MHNIEKDNELSMLLLSDEYNTGRYYMYMAIVNYLISIIEGRKDPILIDKLKTIDRIKELVREVQNENLNKEVVTNIKARECLEASNIEKDAYLISLEKFYINYGYDVEINLPADNIIVQLAFLARLIKDMLKKGENEKIELIKVQSRFIKTHLLNWLGRCANKYKVLELIKQILKDDWGILLEFIKNKVNRR